MAGAKKDAKKREATVEERVDRIEHALGSSLGLVLPPFEWETDDGAEDEGAA